MSAACRRRWLLVSSTACSALALAACGADRSNTETTFPAGVGSSLAAQADRVASRLEAGDADGARSAAVMLDVAVERAIAGGRVPSALRRPLREAVDAILASVPVPAPAATTTAEAESDDKGKGKGHDKDKGEEGDGGDE